MGGGNNKANREIDRTAKWIASRGKRSRLVLALELYHVSEARRFMACSRSWLTHSGVKLQKGIDQNRPSEIP
jgi:hypothetical protein